MKKFIVIQLFFIIAMAFPAVAQDKYEFEVKPDGNVTKEVTLKGGKNDPLKLKIKVEWKAQENRIGLTFDRKSLSDNDAYLLFFPLLADKKSFKKVVDCKLQKKTLWSKTVNAKSNPMSYFLRSDNLFINDQKNCYLSLANNNEEEFSFTAKRFTEDFSIELSSLFVAKQQKKPWFTFSKKDKKLLFKANPVTLVIRPEQPKPVEPDKCETEDIALGYINAHHTILASNIISLKEALNKKNCTFFGLLMENIKNTYNEVNEKCSKYLDCEAISQALKKYNLECEIIMREECVVKTPPPAVCNLSENELTSINSLLKNLQMRINVKKKDGVSTVEEYREYQSIKTNVNPKLTQECRRRFGNLIDAYTNYCTVIESLF